MRSGHHGDTMAKIRLDFVRPKGQLHFIRSASEGEVLFKRISMLAAAAVLSMGTAASASVVLQDNFAYGTTDVLNIGVNFLAPNWTAGPTLDYIYTTGFTNDVLGLCRDGAGATSGCVDLDGSTNSAGLLSSVLTFVAGTYTLDIALFGNNRGFLGNPLGLDDTVTITLGNWVHTISNIASGDDESGSWTFTTTGGALTFQNTGGDNVGAILSSMKLTAIPLPAGGLLLLGALGGLAALRRRRKTA